jgi:hypothetical protein
MGRTIVFGAALLAVLVFTLAFVSKHNQYGGFAKSPQEATMTVGSSLFVAGGKARLWYGSHDLGPRVEVECGKEAHLVELADEEPVDVGCGITLTHLETTEVRGVLRSRFKVEWGEKR